jgi:hypothetical protein
MNYREEAYEMRNLSKSLLDIIGVSDGASGGGPPPPPGREDEQL